MKVGIIRCQQTEDLCPGTGDFAAVEKKSGAFETLGDCTIVGFVSCGGCPAAKPLPGRRPHGSRGAGHRSRHMQSQREIRTGSLSQQDSILQALRKKCKEVSVLEYTH